MILRKEICISEEARREAQDLVNKMRDNSINIENDPSCLNQGLYPKEFAEWQVNNFLSFSRFLESRLGKKIMEMLDDSCALSSEIDFYDGDVEVEIPSVKKHRK